MKEIDIQRYTDGVKIIFPEGEETRRGVFIPSHESVVLSCDIPPEALEVIYQIFPQLQFRSTAETFFDD
ncbi:MAG: hypothetical protein ACD_30C00059G0001 [uncultured bacterium]|nr:MAG: hypothetical protein ACD_30C00059G0001 [uncultured bacterium]